MPAWYTIGTLNIASLLLGLAAWGLPLVGVAKPARRERFTVASFSCCILALVAEILSVGQRVFLGDMSGLEDTMGGIIALILILVGVTFLMNFVARK